MGRWTQLILVAVSCTASVACGGESSSGSSRTGNEGGAESGGSGHAPGSGGAGGALTPAVGGNGNSGTVGGNGNSGTVGGNGNSGTVGGAAPGSGGVPTAGGWGGFGLAPSAGAAATTICESYCATAVAAGCDSPATESECLSGCGFVENIAQCADEFEAAFACGAEAPATCDDQGEATFPGCELAELAAVGCLATLEPPPELATPCADYCDAVAAANCPAEDPDTCPSECALLAALAPNCTPAWGDYFTCAASDTLTCDDAGEITSEGCFAEALAAAGCFLAAGAG